MVTVSVILWVLLSSKVSTESLGLPAERSTTLKHSHSSLPLWGWLQEVWKTDRGRLLSLHPNPPAPSSAVEEGGIGDLLLDNKPTFKEGHTNYITLLVGDITEVAAHAQRFSSEETTGASCRARAQGARGDIWALSRSSPLNIVSTDASANQLFVSFTAFVSWETVNFKGHSIRRQLRLPRNCAQ